MGEGYTGTTEVLALFDQPVFFGTQLRPPGPPWLGPLFRDGIGGRFFFPQSFQWKRAHFSKSQVQVLRVPSLISYLSGPLARCSLNFDRKLWGWGWGHCGYSWSVEIAALS